MNGQFTILANKRSGGVWHWAIRTDCWHEYPNRPEIQQPHITCRGKARTSDEALGKALLYLSDYRSVKKIKNNVDHVAWVIDEGH
jgi:hypothetical protein